MEIPKNNVNNDLFHIICGAFKVQDNASKQVQKMKSEGFNSEIYAQIGGLYHVSIANYPIRPPAIVFLREQRSKGKKIWLLKR